MIRILGYLLWASTITALGACEQEAPAPQDPTSAPLSVTGDGPSVALKGKVRTLAVAAECMRKQGLTSDKMTAAMRTMYQSLGVDLATYGETMSALTDDKAFQKSLAEGIAACPDGTEPVDPPVVEADAGVTDEADTTPAPVEADTAPADEPAVDTVVAALDAVVGDDDDTTGVETSEAPEDTAAAPSDEDAFDEGEDTDEGDPSTEDGRIGTTPPNYDGLYRGTATGGGEIRISIADGRVTSGYAILNGKRLALKGALKDSRVVLSGNATKRKASVHGKVNPATGTISGTWTGLFDGRKKTGRFSAKR